MLKYQGLHILFLLVLLLAVLYVSTSVPEVLSGRLWGYPTSYWMILALLIPVLHQVFVVVCWRLELFGKKLTANFGDRAFTIYKRWFTVLILARPVTLVLLAIANRRTLVIDPALAYALAAILLVPAAYLFYSVKRYFGFDRAFGIDHFEPEKYRNVPLVKKGIFRYTDNGMYTFGFLILYLPGLIWFSKAAILVALFQHLYIWVHHYCTEKPDMQIIYSAESNT